MGSVAGLLPQEGLHHFIAQKKKTTAKTVKGLLNFPEKMTAAKLTVSRYQKRYTREIDCNHLQLFLCLCTGSDLLDKAILTEFKEIPDFLRRPQSHTCGCVLKLPIGYYSYPDFCSKHFYKLGECWALSTADTLTRPKYSSTSNTKIQLIKHVCIIITVVSSNPSRNKNVSLDWGFQGVSKWVVYISCLHFKEV